MNGVPQLVFTVLLASGSLDKCCGHYHPPSDFTAPATPAEPSTSKAPYHMRGPHHPRGTPQGSPPHEHYTPHRGQPGVEGGAPKLTQDTQLLRDEEHIREDLGNIISKEDTKKMSPEELEFHYFKLHDFDNNTKLDGLEILQAIQHIVHGGGHGGDHEDGHGTGGEAAVETSATTEQDATLKAPPPPENDFGYYIELIDKVLAEDDLDSDGYLSYIEYVLGRQKDDHHIQQASKPQG